MNAVSCPICGAPVNLISRGESEARVIVHEHQHVTSYPSDVAACSACEWAVTLTATSTGVVVGQ